MGYRPRISYKSLLIYSLPVAVGAFGSYYFYKRYLSRATPTESIGVVKVVPKSPLEEALALKDKGNKFFKGSRYDQAIQCYTKAIQTCPEEACTELSTFYQNRAAAKENIGEIESAIDDCTFALRYSPRYIKALNRRARLYERTSQPYLSLLDATAVTIFESFSNIDNVMFMERVLTQIASKKAESEKENIKNQFPANAFIRNYFSAFSWDPLLCEESDLIQSFSMLTESMNKFKEDKLKLPYQELQRCLEMNDEKNDLVDFLSGLSEAIKALRNNQYQLSLKTVDEVLSNLDDGIYEQNLPMLPPGKIKIFVALAKLLKGTFMGLTGKAAEAQELFDEVIKTHQESGVTGIDNIINGSGTGDETIDWSKHPMLILIRTNALIKKACLVMTLDQDMARCLSTFQQAEQLCPQCPDVFLHRGQISIISDKFDEAFADFNRAIKLQPNSSMARCQRIFTSYRKALIENDLERAFTRIEEFKKLVSKYPKCIETRSLYAQILAERMSYEESDQEFQEVLRLCPDSGMFYGHRAMLHLRWKQDRDSAMKIINEGLKMDEKCGMLYELSAQIAIEAGDFDTALPQLDMAIGLTTTEPELRHLLALHTGAAAQKQVCEIYGITTDEIKAWHQACQEKMMAAMQSFR